MPRYKGFLQDKQDKPEIKPTDNQKEIARLILEGIRKRKSIKGYTKPSARSITSGAKQVASLSENERWEMKLAKWYSKNSRGAYLPRIDHVQMFYRKLSDLSIAMQREVRLPVDKEIRDKASMLIKRHLILWPDKARDEEQDFMEQTLSCFIVLSKTIRQQEGPFWDHMCAVTLPPIVMAEDWLLATARLLLVTPFAERWNGSLRGFEASIANTRFVDVVNDLIGPWRAPGVWDIIKKGFTDAITQD